MTKTIRITCEGAATMPLDKVVELQGNLKELSVTNYENLRGLIEAEGFAFPLTIARIKGKLYGVVDGHQRHRVVKRMLEEGYTLADGQGRPLRSAGLPVSYVDCKDKAQAGRLILAAVSQFGKVTDEGLYEFMDAYKLDMATLDVMDLPNFDVEKFLESYMSEDGSPVIDRPDGNKAGASPWDRVGDASSGVVFSFGEIQKRVPAKLYGKFVEVVSVDTLEKWLDESLDS